MISASDLQAFTSPPRRTADRSGRQSPELALKTVGLSLVLGTTLVVGIVVPVVAQDEAGLNVSATAADAIPGGPATLVLARDLFVAGIAQGDAVIMLAAAKLAATVDLVRAEPATLDPARVSFAEVDQNASRNRVASVEPESLPAKTDDVIPRQAARATFFPAASMEDSAARAPISAAVMFASARKLATEDELLVSLIDDAAAEGSFGQMVATMVWVSDLPSGQADVWEIPFQAGTLAELAIIGDGDSNLDVAVTDENGNLICKDASWSDTFYCTWTPARDDHFYVAVQNPGELRNSYSLLTN